MNACDISSSPHHLPQFRHLGGNRAAGLLLAALLLMMTGCAAVGPNYEPPSVQLASQWSEPLDPALVPGGEAVRQWWTLFDDPTLTRLIEEAAESNLDLMAAVARVEEARARLGIVTGERQPQAFANGDISRRRASENSLGAGYTETFFTPGLSASWELDLFGRIRRSVEAATADYQASEEDRTDVMITLYTRVALTYLDVRTFQARLSAAESNIASQKEVLELTQARFRNGLATDLDVAQAERILASSESEVPPLRIALSTAVNTLAVLQGRPPGTLNDQLMAAAPIPLPPARATVGVPADLLRQRPDIRAAERNLAAQTARIGVATADLYPSFTLAGAFGFESVDLEDLFEAGSRTLSFGPSLRWQIFSGGSIRSRIDAQDAVTKQALLAYEQRILSALNEVENALRAYLEDRIRLSALGRSVAASQRSVRLSTNLYKQGLVDFQNVLDAQRAQFTAENLLAEARGNSAENFVRLYAALGGGWDPDASPVEAATPAEATAPVEE